MPVSYTHLDVYKRQVLFYLFSINKSIGEGNKIRAVSGGSLHTARMAGRTNAYAAR